MAAPSDETHIPADDDRTAAPLPPRADAPVAQETNDAADDAAGLALPLGTRLNEFEITGVIGEGGFGIVYAAHDHSLDRDVALKEYMPAALATRTQGITVSVRSSRHRETFELGLKSFVNEARLLARFDHPSLVKVYRFWEAHGTAYMVMPHYRGETLKNRLKQSATPPGEAWLRTLLSSLLEALAVIHQENVFHRDIAPDNILLLDDDVPVLLDFGAARRVIGDATQGLTVILKPGYAPVEQYAEEKSMKQGAWTDIYALAATMHFAITGKPPPPSVARMLGDSLVPLAEAARGKYSEKFLAAIDAALKVKPEARPQNVAAFAALLGIAQSGASQRKATAKRAAIDAATGKPGSRGSRLPLIAGGVALATVMGAGGYYWNQGVVPGGSLPAERPLAKHEPAAPAAQVPPQATVAAPTATPMARPQEPAAPAAVPAPQAAAKPAESAVPSPSAKDEVVPRPALAQKPPAATKPVAPKPPPEERQMARADPKPAAPKPPAPAVTRDLGQEAYRQAEPPRDNVQVTALVAQAQQSLSRREFRRAMGLAENALALDPSNVQARDIRRRAQEGEKRAFEEIKIE